MRGPYLPEPRDCDFGHVSLIALLPGEKARCRYCGHLVLPSGRVSRKQPKREEHV